MYQDCVIKNVPKTSTPKPIPNFKEQKIFKQVKLHAYMCHYVSCHAWLYFVS